MIPGSIDLGVYAADLARAFAVPVVLVGELTESEELVAVAHGWNVSHLPLPYSLTSRLAGERDVVVVADTSKDARFANHPLVVQAPNVRFLAAAPFFNGDGDLAGAVLVLDAQPRATVHPTAVSFLRLLARSITREYESRRDIEDANRRFREFFEQTDDLVMSIGSDGRLLHANEAALAILGFTREDLARTPIVRVVDPDERDDFRTTFAEVFEHGEPRHIETTFVTAGGRRMTVEGSLRPTIMDGRAVLARVIFRDITDRKQIEAELGSARDAALEAARLKTQFLTNVSHEIRTPMNGIVGMVDLLLATPLSTEQQDYAHQARASAEQLLAIVNNILYISSIGAGSLSAAAVDFDLYRTLQRIVEVMKIAALGKDIDVTMVYDDRLPPIFRGSQSKIRQVVTNLLDNAVKFTEEGSVVLNVSLETETDTHRVVRFEIRDTGIGVAAEDRLLLFEKFSQVEASSTRRFGGVGLGLATARQLVETMGGLIDAESTPGFGSTFWFTVPFPKQLTATRRPIASSDLDFRGKRVLLVDHDATSRKIVRHYLEATWQMRVELENDGASALAALRRAATENDPVRVAIFESPADMDALEFARTVHADPTISDTSLIHLAPAHGGTDESRLREAGINAYVVKPVGQGELFDAMTLALAQDAIPLARAAGQPGDSRPAPPPVTPEMKKRVRVLLAEDNFLNMKLTMSQLQKLGYEADSVANGKEALEAIDKRVYDIVLMDCQMPVLDGYQATIEIRRREHMLERRHRIIAMTANALEGDREKCLAAGMDDYLSKPTKHDELDVALARYFASDRSSESARRE